MLACQNSLFFAHKQQKYYYFIAIISLFLHRPPLCFTIRKYSLPLHMAQSDDVTRTMVSLGLNKLLGDWWRPGDVTPARLDLLTQYSLSVKSGCQFRSRGASCRACRQSVKYKQA